jgi:hypothetical protein
MPFQRIHLTVVVAALFLAGSAALAVAQTSGGTGPGAGKSGTATGSSESTTGTPSALDTTGMGGSRPGCGPSPGSASTSSADSPSDATAGGVRAPRIINDPTVGTSDTAETGLAPNSVIPKDSKTGKAGDC